MDPALARTVLEQLLDNAWKFSQRRDAPQVELGTTPGDSGATTFFVRDNGRGFDDTGPAAGRLFAPFKRMPEATDYPGTGIGLATAARIVQAHGGTCRLRSDPGSGTTITCSLGGL
jgi:signal transduction histidine kinase